ncbi:DUF6002 family protein [Streptomyces sp. NPDC050759]|uniref:DUF6002 family protein n=1 Tax=Streptomyces sp. NPDC050759 TaxID=3365635 RepID=UPI0037AA9D00
MPAPALNGETGRVVRNALWRYLPEIQTVAKNVTVERTTQPAVPLDFSVTDRAAFERFTDVSDIALTQLDEGTHLLDLMRNPGTRTTKTIASLLMIARAVSHIRRTGERVLLLTPTSGNKGTALRDAVARAHASGLATPDELRIVMLAPEASRSKLRDCALTTDAQTRRGNPVVLARVDRPADVKLLSNAVAEQHADELLTRTGFRLWYTLDLDNYRIADAVRAFVEHDLMPLTENSAPRTHVHAVSSAFGLLGYHLGHRLLTEGLRAGDPGPARHPAFFLVQQPATPDMVVSLLGTDMPDYAYDNAAGAWRQNVSPAFPAVTDDPAEAIDATFYTKQPVTSAQINGIVAEHGGGGVVVSRRECLDRLDQVRELAARAGVHIDPDTTLIREWSLVKALTGTLVARERGLLRADEEVVVHASGFYTDSMIPPMRDEHIERVATVDEMVRLVFAAARD